MPRHNKLILDTIPIQYKGKSLRMIKSYTGQGYASHTVLTNDVFPYVSFYFQTHKKSAKYKNIDLKTKYGNPEQYRYDFYWHQAEVFYKATQSLPFESAPLTAYYCMLNTVKAYLAYKADYVDDYVMEFGNHGIQEGNPDSDIYEDDLDKIYVKHKERGVFPLFARTLDADFLTIWPTSKEYSVKSLMYNLAFIHRAYVMTYSRKSKKVDELFVPIKGTKDTLVNGDCPAYYKGNDGKAYLCFGLDKNFFAPNAQIIPTVIQNSISPLFSVSENNGFMYRVKNGVRYYNNSISHELKEANDEYRKYFSYIRGDKRLWYLKRTELKSSGSEVINLCDLSINMAVMHRLSEIARYKPEQMKRITASKENWLLHEYIMLSLNQFIDEIACEITKLEIMCVGRKTM